MSVAGRLSERFESTGFDIDRSTEVGWDSPRDHAAKGVNPSQKVRGTDCKKNFSGDNFF